MATRDVAGPLRLAYNQEQLNRATLIAQRATHGDDVYLGNRIAETEGRIRELETLLDSLDATGMAGKQNS